VAETGAEALLGEKQSKDNADLQGADVHPALHSLSAELRGTFVRLLAYLCGIAALAFFTAGIFRTAPVVAAIEPSPRPEWVEVTRPHPAFDLTIPELFDYAPQYAIRRHADGGGRKDIMTWGEPGRSARYVMVEIYRPGSELERFADPASEIAARAAALGPAGAVKISLPIDSKFGRAASVEFTIGRFGIGHCIGFVHDFDAPRLQISGVSCSMDSIVDRSSIACALDRLTMLSAGGDARLAELFARAEVNRAFCGQRDPLIAATPKRPHPGPIAYNPFKLRGRLSAR
jgi:hypothetical protein